MASKGKGIAGKDSSGKRKRGNNDDKAGAQKRKNRDVLQFFEDTAFECEGLDSSDDDLFGDDSDFLDDFDIDPKVKSEPGRFEEPRVFPKEEELSGDELEKMLEERYRSGSGYVRYAEDDYDNKRSVDRNFLVPSVMEPAIWKVKCKVGRERHSVFCLMQKYVDLKVLGTKLQIISAFAVEHIKGFVFIEAEKQSDVIEACNQLADVYISLVTKVPLNEVSQLMVVRKRYHEVKEGTWARVKNGIYRGDIAQVVTVNNERKRATIKLIPRVDLQALAGKYGGAAPLKKTKSVVPAARLISSSELEEFRPVIQYRRDRDTGKFFEFLDGLMLKDGFLFKKVSFDSLSFWDVNPTEEELLKFTLPSTDESDNLDWLSQLYGEQKEQKKKPIVVVSKGGGKGEGSSGSNEQSSFEVHDLVLFGKRDFGMVIGMEKDESYKILKNSSEGPVTLTLGQKDLKYIPLEKKFTALDHRMKTISVNDTVKILNGPAKGRQGTVKQIYRGIIFLYDENDFDNAYFCANSQMSEKVKQTDSVSSGKVEEFPSGFEDVPSSPKSPLSVKKPWQMREDDRSDKDGMFSVGQSLRIRIGPLKGYLCRVLAIRYSDVTVKLDSKQKVLTVKRDHLAEVRGKSSATSMSDDTGLASSFKPFDLLGSDGGTNDWLQGASGSANGDGWNVGGPSGERSAWPAFSSEGAAAGNSAGALPGSADNDSGKDVNDVWLSKTNSNQNSSWGAAANEKAVGNSDQAGAWGTSDGGWGKSSVTVASSSWDNAKVPGGDAGGWGKSSVTVASSSWGNAKVAGGDDGGNWKVGGSSMDQGKEDAVVDTWNKGKGAEEVGGWSKNVVSDNVGTSGWGKKTSEEGTNSLEQSTAKPGGSAWGEAKGTSDPAEDSWGKASGQWGNKNTSNVSSEWKSSAGASEPQAGGWGQAKEQSASASGGWKNNSLGEDSNGKWGKSNNSSNWGKGGDSSQGVNSWNKPEGAHSWDQSRNGENDQGFRGRGSGGRRGRGGPGGSWGGRDQSGRGRGGSFDRGQISSWNQENQAGSSWGASSDRNKDQGSGWGNAKGWSSEGKSDWKQGSRGSTEGNQLNSTEPPFERSSDSGGWKQQSSWEKGKSADDNSTWGKSTEFHSKGNVMEVDEPWAKAKDAEDKVTEGSSKDTWGKAADKWGNMGNSSKSKEWKTPAETPTSDGKGWGKGSGGWTHSQEGNTVAGGMDAGGWKSCGDSSQGKMDTWNKPKSFGAEGGSWDKSGGNDSWDQSKSFENDRGFNGGRGSGGRRGRGRDQFGRGRGRSFERGNSSSWNKDSQEAGVEASWSKDQGGSSWGNSAAGSDGQGSGWGRSKGWNNNEGGEGKGWNKSGELGNEGGGSFEKTSSQTGWNGGDSSQGKSWSKAYDSEGGASRSFENDQGFGRGRGSGGRRGRGGGFRGGRDQSGRGQFSSWKNENQAGGSSGGNGGGSSWSQGWSNGGGESKGWSKGGEGGSSWATGRGNDQSGGWGKAKAWNDSGADKGGTSDQGGPSWGNSSGNRSGDIGQGGSSWGNSLGNKGGTANQGGSSWGNLSGDKCGGSSWGNPSGDKGGVSSWGNPSGNKAENAAQGGSSWGNSPRDKAENAAPGGSWGKSFSDKAEIAAQGGSSGGNPSENKGENAAQGGSSWGDSSGNKAENKGENAAQGGSSWGDSSGNKAENATQGGSSWGNPSENKGENATQGGSSWGNSSGNKAENAAEGGSSWGKLPSGGSSAAGGGWA